jgi:hypothetical protein
VPSHASYRLSPRDIHTRAAAAARRRRLPLPVPPILGFGSVHVTRGTCMHTHTEGFFRASRSLLGPWGNRCLPSWASDQIQKKEPTPPPAPVEESDDESSEAESSDEEESKAAQVKKPAAKKVRPWPLVLPLHPVVPEKR